MVRPHCHWERGGRQRALIPLLLLSWWLQATTAISYHDYIHDILLWLMGTGYHILLWLQQLLTLELTTPLLATTATMMKQSPRAQGHHGDYSRSRILFLLPPPPALEPTTTTTAIILTSHIRVIDMLLAVTPSSHQSYCCHHSNSCWHVLATTELSLPPDVTHISMPFLLLLPAQSLLLMRNENECWWVVVRPHCHWEC